MKTHQKRFAKAINALSLEVDRSIALNIYELHLAAIKEYATSACEDLRERIAEEAKVKTVATPLGDYHEVNKESILETEIILP